MKKYYWKICYFLRVEWIFNCAYSVEECFKFSGICFLVNVINVEGSYSNSSESNFLLTFSIDFKLPRKERCWGWYARWRCEKFLFDMRSSFCVRFSLLITAPRKNYWLSQRYIERLHLFCVSQLIPSITNQHQPWVFRWDGKLFTCSVFFLKQSERLQTRRFAK